MFSKEQRGIINAIHSNVFKRFTYVPDLTEYPDWDDYWSPIPASILARGAIRGDCDEFARICLLKCMGSGLKARLVFCLDENRDGHLICEVTDELEQQTLYLDNRKKQPVNIDGLTGYHFIGIGPWNPQPADSRPWYDVDQAKLVEITTNQGTAI